MRLKILILLSVCSVSFLSVLALDQSLMDLSYVHPDILVAHNDYIQGAKDPRWYLINVLSDDLCRECTIPGSINIPVHKLHKKLSNSKKWPLSRKIILYCAGGDCPLSRYAYEIVKKLGFVDVHVLAGGLAGWVANKLPVQGSCLFKYLHS